MRSIFILLFYADLMFGWEVTFTKVDSMIFFFNCCFTLCICFKYNPNDDITCMTECLDQRIEFYSYITCDPTITHLMAHNVQKLLLLYEWQNYLHILTTPFYKYIIDFLHYYVLPISITFLFPSWNNFAWKTSITDLPESICSSVKDAIAGWYFLETKHYNSKSLHSYIRNIATHFHMCRTSWSGNLLLL